ncbi:MAG: acylphosphatase [Gammaproteobacteria bacterium]|nr:acylphosphatase [Gammaproteobacteria bacterium]
MANKLCIHCFVSGKVQGVWFRASTQAEAKRLAITGWARNLADGRVEVMACGEQEKINELYAWLQHGPELASVVEVTYEELAWQAYDEFTTL